VLLADVEVEIEIATALAVLRRAVELGVDFIDTADSYGPNVSEESIAEALFPYPAGVVIATKGGWNRPGPNQWTHDATPAHLRQAVEGSLKRLRLDRIDVYQLHIPDPVVSFEASVETLAQLRNEGKIRLVALSNVTQDHIERAAKSSLSPLCRIATALPTASGITWWIIVSTTGLPLFRGSPWEQAKLLATC
jgi:aryl-alcohol dehydrogenase-like predicted oxidoreductase